MKNYKKLNNLIGWIVFIIASIVFLSTIEPTASWWDCGEYIATAYKLQVGHPPGAPFFQMLGRFFSLFAFGDVSHVAKMINIMSALASSFTILFLFWSITALAKKIVLKNDSFIEANKDSKTNIGSKLPASQDNMTKGKMYAIFGSGIVGALAYTFTDSFWFSAVEGEVYAMSSFFTAFVFWSILKWESAADEKYSSKWIILIAYFVGLSIGVHLLSLLVIPAITFVFYFKKYKPTWKGGILTAIISILILAFIMYGIIPEIVNLFTKTELLFVNDFGLPFNSGTIFFAVLLISFIIFSLIYTTKTKADKSLSNTVIILISLIFLLIFIASTSAGNFFVRFLICTAISVFIYLMKKKKSLLNTIILGFTFILIGYSSFLMIIIRANANTPINENSPKDAIGLFAYLNREQYGSWPIFYGKYYNAPLDKNKPYLDGTPIYIKDKKKGKYIVTDDRKASIPNYDSRFCTIFPRMWSSQKKVHIKVYKSWGGNDGIPIEVQQNDGTKKIIYKPTFGENLRYFFTYQLGHMYWRYFMWNFVGRQNNIEEGNWSYNHGNWISGINFIDKQRLGDQNNLPESMKNNAHNKFYFLPLILGLIGFLFHIKKDPKNAFVVFLMFFMTGIAIVLYLNQYPYQPRERDYSYAGSFYAFAMWIGLGVLALFDAFKEKYRTTFLAIIITLICLIFVPGIMAEQGWDDHDRSGKYATRDFAANYLNSCAPNAILFTNGDNDTFPLWYDQEVEGIRTDVRVVNFMLASGDWYIHQMAKKVYNSAPLPLTLKPEQYDKGVNEIIPYYNRNIKGYVELKDLINFIASNNRQTKIPLSSGKQINYIPTKKIKITVDSAAVVDNGIVPKSMAGKIVHEIKWDLGTNYIYKNGLMLLDLIATNNWKRPIYFANPSSLKKYLDVDKYCHLEGIVYKFMPIKATKGYISGMGGISVDTCYDILMNRCKWGNLNDPKVNVDRESYRNSMIPKQDYMRLAQALLQENKKDSAVAVLDKCIYFFPNDKFTFDFYMLPFVDIYYKAGAIKKANAMTEKLASIYEQNIEYYNSLDEKFFKSYSEDMQQAFEVLQRLSMMAKENKQIKISDKIQKFLKEKLQYLK